MVLAQTLMVLAQTVMVLAQTVMVTVAELPRFVLVIAGKKRRKEQTSLQMERRPTLARTQAAWGSRAARWPAHHQRANGWPSLPPSAYLKVRTARQLGLDFQY